MQPGAEEKSCWVAHDCSRGWPPLPAFVIGMQPFSPSSIIRSSLVQVENNSPQISRLELLLQPINCLVSDFEQVKDPLDNTGL